MNQDNTTAIEAAAHAALSNQARAADCEALAREIFVSFVSSPLFAQQCEEGPGEDDHMSDLGQRTAYDAFDLAVAFLNVADEMKQVER
jgi:hypothetical protein